MNSGPFATPEMVPKVSGVCVTDGLVAALTPTFAQYDGCFRAFTIPDMGAPSQPITFGMCSELTNVSPLYHALSPFKYDQSGVTGVPGTITELQNAAYEGGGSDNLVAERMADVLRGLDTVVISEKGGNSFNPLDLDGLVKMFGGKAAAQ